MSMSKHRPTGFLLRLCGKLIDEDSVVTAWKGGVLQRENPGIDAYNVKVTMVWIRFGYLV